MNNLHLIARFIKEKSKMQSIKILWFLCISFFFIYSANANIVAVASYAKGKIVKVQSDGKIDTGKIVTIKNNETIKTGKASKNLLV